MINGQLSKRLKLYTSRLLDNLYDCPDVFHQTSDWPGDFPGRTLLALTSIYLIYDEGSTERQIIKERLDKFFKHLDMFTNENHFFGPLFDKRLINEQQLSGNSWYIRGLCRYYEIFKDNKVLEYLNTIIDSFLLPLSFEYHTYPITSREVEGGVAGHLLQSKDNKWMLSSDVGCAYLMLDGYVSVYEVTKDQRLKDAIASIIEQYQKIDYVALKCQTHATLTCARAILRFYQQTHEEKYLLLAKNIFDKYQKVGMTDDYQNLNWFQRPDSWTEPCCVIDSLILAKHLYLITKDKHYLVLLNRIYTNGLRTFQRDNGGAGCTTIQKDGVGQLKMFMYEAYFCCTLREGEGFYELSRSIIKDNNLYLLMIPESFEDENIKVVVDLYEDKVIYVEFKKPGEISLYVPNGFKCQCPVKDNLLTINSNTDVSFEIDIQKVDNRYLYGDMLLSKKKQHIDKMYYLNNKEYSYISDSSSFKQDELKDLIQEL